ncbi:MAG: hypothetical protein NZU63_14385 [Gemmataceae bacterium]|nr:hypothetical protein [Gemmataceae bacterium]MDW8244504.1 hypothetical protein [Thermogemmata sp.]
MKEWTLRLGTFVLLLGVAGTLTAQDPKGAAAAQAPQASQPPKAASPDADGYFPLTPKTKWIYKVQDQTVEVLVDKNEKFKEETCTKVDTLVSGKVVASELYCVRSDGLYRVKVKDDEISPPVRVLALPIQKGYVWDVNSKVGAQAGQLVRGKFQIVNDKEKIKVPAGEYEAVVVEGVDMDVAGTKTTVRLWFVKGIGLVKLTYKIADTESTLELEKYEPATNRG